MLVTKHVLMAAGIEEEEEPRSKYSSDFAWKMYNFVCQYKSGSFGEVTLQTALDRHFEEFEESKSHA